MLNKIFTVFLINIALFLPASVAAQNPLGPEPTQEIFIEAKEADQRTVILRDYLKKHHSPLTKHAQDFVDAADLYGVDWKLVPAISGVESTFGKFIPGGYNGWGWGVYGDQAIYFKSWREAIFTVTKGLKEGYINKGLITPYQMNRVYAASPAWGWKVAYFMQEIDQFSSSYPSNKLSLTKNELGVKVSKTSARLNPNSTNLLALIP